MKLVFCGTPSFAVPTLEALLAAGHEIALVVSQPDRPVGRHLQLTPPPVKQAALTAGLAVTQPEKIRNNAEFRTQLEVIAPACIVVVAYGRIIPSWMLALPRFGCINPHASLLPKYRGRAPVNWAILNGERETGATLHEMVARADAGDIVDQMAVPILADDEAREVYAKVTVAAEIVLARSLPGLLAGTAPRRPQPIVPGQYFGRRRPEDGRIDWSWPAARVHNLVRAVAPPFPGAFSDVGRGRLWIHRTRLEAHGDTGAPRLYGRAGACYAACAQGTLRILAAADDRGPLDLTRAARDWEAQPRSLV